MAQWQILDKSGIPTGAVFDDGLLADPGDPDFTTDAVKAHIAKGESFNCMGRSPQAHAEKKAAEIEAQRAKDFAASVAALEQTPPTERDTNPRVEPSADPGSSA